MRFDRYPRKRQHVRTGRRIAAAKRAIQRQLDAVPLFPELVKHRTVEERMDAMEAGSDAMIQSWRDNRADNWRKARRELRELPPLRQSGLSAYLAQAGCPGDPVYLLEMLREARTRCGNFWSRLRRLQQMRLVGAGRLPRETVFTKCSSPSSRQRSLLRTPKTRLEAHRKRLAKRTRIAGSPSATCAASVPPSPSPAAATSTPSRPSPGAIAGLAA